MPMLKKGDTAIHFGFANGAMANKLFARNIEITKAGDRLILDLRHHANPRRDLSDGDYRLLITTTAPLTSAVIMDRAFPDKLAKVGAGLTDLEVRVSATVTLQMPIGAHDLQTGFLKR
jgi:hypothetical protein